MSNIPNASGDFLQAAWTNPPQEAIYRNKELGLLIVPDKRPVVPLGHVLVITERQSAFEDLTPLERFRLNEGSVVVSDWMQEKLFPSRGVAILKAGNQAKTAHLHVLPRDIKTDGSLFFESENPDFADQDRLDATRDIFLGTNENGETFEEVMSRRIGAFAIKKVGPLDRLRSSAEQILSQMKGVLRVVGLSKSVNA